MEFLFRDTPEMKQILCSELLSRKACKVHVTQQSCLYSTHRLYATNLLILRNHNERTIRIYMYSREKENKGKKERQTRWQYKN